MDYTGMARADVIREKVAMALSGDEHNEFEVEGKTFKVKLYKNGDLNVWTNNGSRSLFSCERDYAKYPDLVIATVIGRIDDYCDGYIHCSCCGKMFPTSEIEGYKRSYFAGVYCQECWDRTYKAIEANETYD